MIEGLMIVFSLSLIAVAVGMAIANILFGMVYDTDHFGDTVFLLGAGWRALNGLTPVVDFGHFYGGVMAEGIGLTMRLFGPDVFAFERFTLLTYLVFIPATVIILAGRMSAGGIAAVCLTLAVLLLTRYPLELNDPIIRIVSTHSFLYNRVGLGLVLVVGLFAILQSPEPKKDVVPGLLAGVGLGILALIKPTFAIFVPCAVLALVLQLRWHAIGAVTVGLVAFLAVYDPVLQKWSGALSYIQAQVGASNNATLEALLRKSVQVPLYQPVATAITVVAMIMIVRERRFLMPLLSLLIIAGGGVVMATTMGGNGSIGQLGIPLAILITSAFMELRIADTNRTLFLRAATFALVAAFALPHTLNLVGATIEGMNNSGAALIEQGPYTRYLSIPESPTRDGVPSQYEMMADGITALHALGDPSKWGIIADQNITFEHAVLGRPVPDYPLWQRITAPELSSDKSIPDDADIVMIGRSGDMGEVGKHLQGRLLPDFMRCARSAHWYIFARLTSDVDCQID
ncbi:hypothetical protein [Hwanghaeella sp.]|uniref:hypothetical protein n=1 Tax=Hwanghaeella sp. TaxID=2605943 RepID=UPI003CCC24BE